MFGRMPTWGVVAFAIAVIALGIGSASAAATTDRVDYSDQANPICASTNKQYEQVYEDFEATLERLDDRRSKNRKQVRKRIRRFERLYEQLPFRIIALYKAELEQLKAISPPPGYEDTVAQWLGTRGEIAALYEEYIRIDQQLEGPLVEVGKSGKRPSPKAIKRAQKRRATLHRREDQIEEQFLKDSEIDLELGSKLGAAYCVTGADGEIAVSFLEDWGD